MVTKENSPHAKVLLVTMNFPPPDWGGSVVYLSHIVSNLPAESIKVLTSSKGNIPAENKHDQAQRYEIVRLPVVFSYQMALTRRMKLKALAIWLVGLWQHIDPSTVHVVALENALYLGLPVRIICNLRHIPYIVFAFGEELSQTLKARSLIRNYVRYHIYRCTLKGAAKVVSISRPTSDLLTHFEVQKSKIELIYPPTRLPDEHPNQVELGRFRARYDLQAKRILASVGTFKPRKGFDNLIQAMPIVLQQYPNTVLVLVGSGPLEEALVNLAQDLKITENIRFLGRVDQKELALLYASCELFVMPNRTLSNGDVEGYGMVFNEANAFGKMAIGGCSGGTVDAIQDQQTGLLVDGQNISEIGWAICEILGDPERARRMGENARNWLKVARSPARAARQFHDIVLALAVSRFD